MEPRDALIEDMLLSRVVDGAATSEDWQQLEVISAHDSRIWERLGMAIRCQGELGIEVERAMLLAEEVEVPQPQRPVRWFGRLGWAAALVLAGVLLFQETEPTGTAGLLPLENTVSQRSTRTMQPVSSSSEDAFESYLEAGLADGRVVKELPRLVLKTNPGPDDQGVEVYYVRRLLERVVVDQFYDIGEDEQGRATSVPVSAVRFASAESL